MYKLIEWNNPDAYWLIIIKNGRVKAVLTSIHKKDNKPLIISIGDVYHYYKGNFANEQLLEESYNLEELIEKGMLHLL